jgi:hypothetical protein
LKIKIIFLIFSGCFDVLILKIIFKNKKIYFLIYFQIKNTLKITIIILLNTQNIIADKIPANAAK